MILSCVAAAALLACGGPTQDPEKRFVDLVLRGGTVLDGSGGMPQIADVAIDGQHVRVVEFDTPVRGRREIDASGFVVAPGFVDLHSHADLIVLGSTAVQEALLGAKISQGVTSIIVGNCGLGVAPTTSNAAQILKVLNGWMTPDGIAAGTLSVGDYLARLEDSGIALNVGTLAPHGPLRISAMGMVGGEPSEVQLEAMRRQLRASLAEGAFGLSAGLIYPPGMYSATDELVELARVVAAADGLFTSHVRGSSETLLDATRELIDIARRSGAAVHHSHLEAVGERFWPGVADVLQLEDEARASGLRVSHDVFPYTRAATMMSAIFPPWSLDGGLPSLLGRLEDPLAREQIRSEIDTRTPEWPSWVEGGWPHNLVSAVGWDGIIVSSVRPDGPTELEGRSLAEIAAESGTDPFDVVADLMISQGGQVGQFVDQISGREDRLDALVSILTHPAAAVISDAEDYGRGMPHPAHAGAFARALRLNRERGLLPLQEIVRRMTAYPASIIGLEDRGVIREGAFADVVVFDPDRIADRAGWKDPRRLAVGVEWVIVNGRIVVESGEYLGGLHGHVLRARR